MALIGRSLTFTVAQMGTLRRTEARDALALANEIQTGFRFEMYHPDFPIDRKRYKLPYSNFDLDSAAQHLIRSHDLPKPIVFMTSLPYGERDTGGKKGVRYFSNHHPDFDREVSIVSTYLWERLPGRRRLQPYILYSLAAAVLSKYGNLQFHAEERECPFSRSDDPKDIDYSFAGRGLCYYCQRSLQAKGIALGVIASAKKLFNRASGKKTCFLVMPFQPRLKPVRDAVKLALGEDWTVVSGHDIVHPRRITDAIWQNILESDLVVADLTGSNPNVFYEVGVAHAIGCDVIMLTQEKSVPFDVITEQTIFYELHKRGLARLEDEVREKARLRS